MNRYGFDETELDAIAAKLKTSTQLNILSICSHLASADKVDKKEFTEKQLLKFQKIALTFEKHVKQSMLKHILNSHGVINFPEYQLDIVRLGIGLYGSAKDKQLLPISNLKSVITQNRTIKVGETVGYGPSFVATKEINI